MSLLAGIGESKGSAAIGFLLNTDKTGEAENKTSVNSIYNEKERNVDLSAVSAFANTSAVCAYGK